MKYRLVYNPTFEEDIADHVHYLRGEHVSEEVIERWYTGLFDLVLSLDEMPNRFGVDRALTAALGRETRKVNYKTYIVSYQVDAPEKVVELIAFVHGSTRDEA